MNEGNSNKTRSEKALARARRLIKSDILAGRPDPEGLLALTRIIFPGEDISDPRYLPWLYDQNPGGRAYEFMTKNEAMVTGHSAAVPLRFKIGATNMMGSLGVNAITHPDYRGRGIFILLYEEIFKLCARDENQFMFGFANTSSHKGCLRHLGFREIGQFPLWIRPFDLRLIIRAQKSKQGRLWRAAARAANPFLNPGLSILGRRRKGPAPDIEKISEIGPEFDDFWERVKDDYTNILIRDRKFLDWRFVRHPTRRYEIFTARRGGKLQGYLAGKLMSIEGLRWGMIVDLLASASAEGEAAAGHLISAFTKYAQAGGAALMGCLMFKHTSAAKALRRNAYFICPKSLLPREFPILLRWNPPSPSPAGFFDLNTWSMTLGDYDAV